MEDAKIYVDCIHQINLLPEGPSKEKLLDKVMDVHLAYLQKLSVPVHTSYGTLILGTLNEASKPLSYKELKK